MQQINDVRKEETYNAVPNSISEQLVHRVVEGQNVLLLAAIDHFINHA
jgi:hypothetical protein